jgi:hypothetical protein
VFQQNDDVRDHEIDMPSRRDWINRNGAVLTGKIVAAGCRNARMQLQDP